MIVYMVSHGDYSDYGIAGIFSTRSKAQEYIDFQRKIDQYSGINDCIDLFEVDEWKKASILYARIDVLYGELKVSMQEEQPRSFREGESFNNNSSMFVRIHYNMNPKVMIKSAIDKYYAFIARSKGI